MKNLFCFLLLISILPVFSNCANKEEDPRDVVQNFFSAIQQKNYNEAKKYATKESQDVLDMLAKLSSNSQAVNPNATFDINNLLVSGDEATANVAPSGSAKGVTISLRKENGTWKVAFDINSVLKMAKSASQ